MPSINLAPGTQYIVQARKRRRRLFGVSILIIAIVAAVWTGLALYQRRLLAQQQEVQNRLRNVELEIARIEPNANRIVLFEDRLEALDALLNQHISWDGVLQDIERLMPPETVLTSIDVRGDTGQITVDGVTPNIDQVALTLASLLKSPNHETIFSDGTLHNIQREEVASEEEGVPPAVRYTFAAELNFTPSIIRNGQ